MDPVSAAVAAVVEHLAGELPDVQVFRGWPEPGQTLDLSMSSAVAVTAGRPRYELCPPAEVDREGTSSLAVTYRVALLEVTVQVDLWSSHRARRDQVSAALEGALHNQLPRTSGLWLTSAGYHDRPLSLEAAEAFDHDELHPQRGEWRRTWSLTCQTDLVAVATYPAAAQVDLELLTELGAVERIETNTFTP